MGPSSSEDYLTPLPTFILPPSSSTRPRANTTTTPRQRPLPPSFLRHPSVTLSGGQPSPSPNLLSPSTSTSDNTSFFRTRPRSASASLAIPSSSTSAYPPTPSTSDLESGNFDSSASDGGGGGASLNAGGKTRMKRALSAMTFWSADEGGSNVGEGEEREETEEEKESKIVAEKRAKHDQQVVDLLDVIDPEVGTLTTLSDLQNSLFVPDLGRWVDRARFLKLTKPDAGELAAASLATLAVDEEPPSPTSPPPKTLPQIAISTPSPSSSITATAEEPPEPIIHRSETQALEAEEKELKRLAELATAVKGKYLILPKGLVDWEHWSDEEKEELDDYVRHLLHSKKWKVKRGWRGFKQYFRTPLGAFVTIYASLLTFWGAAWVLFIIGWLNAGDRQAYFVEICDQVLTALFCVVGIGLAPFRVVDTYHMIYIAHFHRKSLRLYAEHGAPPLRDENDLPSPNVKNIKNTQEGKLREPVLSVEEQATFIYHQMKFQKSHTFYRPHETFTHKAFPLDLLIVVVCLLDFHSLFQIALGSTTWSISYHHDYKKILTSIILSFSISCNITAGLVIAVGNRRTRKEEIVTALLHKAVTEEAVRRRKEKREKELRGGEEKKGLVRERLVEDRGGAGGEPILG